MRKYRTLESSTLNACIRYLWARGCYVWRQNTGAMKTEDGRYVRFGQPGIADIIGCTRSGRFLAVETKSPKGRLTDQQKLFQERIVAHGGIYVVARSLDDLEAIKDQLA